MTHVSFDTVRKVGLTLADVEAAVRYDGSPVLKACGCFMAGLATHESAEADSLVVRIALDERELLLEDAPDTYYVTDYYRKYPLVLVRLSQVDEDALRDLLSVSHRLALAKAGKGRAPIKSAALRQSASVKRAAPYPSRTAPRARTRR